MGSLVIGNLVVGAGLCLAGLITLIWQAAVARRFPLGGRAVAEGPAQPVSVLKPVHGADPGMQQALRTWLELEYPAAVEILLVVDAADTAAQRMVGDLLLDWRMEVQTARPGGEAGGTVGSEEDRGPGIEARLLVCSGFHGANRKVSKILEAAAQAQYETWVVSDADVAVPADLLRQVTGHLRDPEVGLASCLYGLAAPRTPAMRWEAVAVNIDFWSQVLQARSLGALDFGLGAVMAMPKRWVERAGGFEAVADFLADDFQLGNRIHAAGGRIELSGVTVTCLDPQRGWAGVWRHQLRWGRTIRVSRPWPYFASVLGNALFGPLVWLGWAGLLAGMKVPGSGQSLAWGLAALGVMAFARIRLALDLQRRFVTDPAARVPWWMVFVKDVLALAIWVASFTGSTVEWRSQRYRVGRDGRLTPAQG